MSVDYTNIFTGVGSRKAPIEILTLIFYFSRSLAASGWALRSGGAIGCDDWFYRGYMDYFHSSPNIHYPNVEIHVPDTQHKAYRQYPEHCVIFNTSQNYELALVQAASIHPNWAACDTYARNLHGRNIYQVLGVNLDRPSNVYICWAPISKDTVTGGTRSSYECAKRNGVKIINLANPKHFNKVLAMLEMTEAELMKLSGK